MNSVGNGGAGRRARGSGSSGNSTVVCKVKELRFPDRIPYGTVIGPLIAADTLVVSRVFEADEGKWALVLARVGTIYVNGDLMVEILSDRYEDDDPDE